MALNHRRASHWDIFRILVQLWHGLVHVSQQVNECEKKLNKLLKAAGHGDDDAEIVKLTAKLHAKHEDLQAAIDQYDPQQPPPPKP